MSKSEFTKSWNRMIDVVGPGWGCLLLVGLIMFILAVAAAFWGGMAFAIATGTNWALGYVAIPVKQAVMFGAVVMPFVVIALRSLFSSSK